jgi:putative phosphoesterase
MECLSRVAETHLFGVLSDTHGRLPPGVLEVFEGVEAILHAGDVGAEDILIELRALGPVHAVRGNIETSPLITQLPLRLVLDLNGLRVGMAHGHLHGGPSDRHARMREAFRDDTVDLVICGHTHRACCDTSARPWIVNPGSASQGRGAGRSVALLKVGAAGPRFEIVGID